MSTDIKIDNFGNPVKVNGDLVLISGKEEIAQRLKSRFATFYTSWRYDRRLGFPTVGAGGMFDNGTPLTFRLAMCRKYITDTKGILGISQFDAVVDPESKGLRIAATVQTEFGDLATEIEIA